MCAMAALSLTDGDGIALYSIEDVETLARRTLEVSNLRPTH